jgi:alanyl-tRNA synthetase
MVDELAAKFQCLPNELPTRVDALQDQVKTLQSQLKKAVGAALTSVVDDLIASAPEVKGAKIVVAKLPDGASNDNVRTQIDRVKQKCGSAFVVFGWSEEEGKASIIAALTPDLVKKGLKSGDVVKHVAEVIGKGGGGGKPDMAQTGGNKPANLPEALQKAERLGRELLGK